MDNYFPNFVKLLLLHLPDGQLEGVHLAEPLLVGQGGDVLPETLEGVIDALHPPPLAHVGRVSDVHLAYEAPAQLPPHLLAVEGAGPKAVRGRVWEAGVLTSGLTSRVLRVGRVTGPRAVIGVIEAFLERWLLPGS